MSTYYGRCGSMVDRVLFDFNDSNSKFATEGDVLAVLNRGIEELARDGTFSQVGTMDVVAGTAAYELVTIFTDIVDPVSVFWSAPWCELSRLSNANEYRRSLDYIPTSYRPAHWLNRNGWLMVSPIPTADAEDAMTVIYHYTPPAMNGLQNDVYNTESPPVLITTAVHEPAGLPRVFDEILVEYALWKLFIRDRHSPLAPEMATLHMGLFQKLRAKMAGTAPIQIRPYR